MHDPFHLRERETERERPRVVALDDDVTDEIEK